MESPCLAYQSGHIAGCGDDGRLFRGHRNQVVLSVDEEVHRHAEGNLDRSDDVFHHMVGHIEAESAAVGQPADVLRIQVAEFGYFLLAFGNSKLVKSGKFA